MCSPWWFWCWILNYLTWNFWTWVFIYDLWNFVHCKLQRVICMEREIRKLLVDTMYFAVAFGWEENERTSILLSLISIKFIPHISCMCMFLLLFWIISSFKHTRNWRARDAMFSSIRSTKTLWVDHYFSFSWHFFFPFLTIEKSVQNIENFFFTCEWYVVNIIITIFFNLAMFRHSFFLFLDL